MAKFRVQYVEGESAESAGRIDFTGLHADLTIEAPDRAAAFVAASRTFAARGFDVTVLHIGYPERQPLGFTPDEVNAIREAGGVLRDGYPEAGVQIERIEAL